MSRLPAALLSFLLVTALVTGTAAAGGGSPFNGHYEGTSLNGRHHVDVNVNGARARTANLKLACGGGRPVFADFLLNDRVSDDGRFTAKASSSRASVRGKVIVRLDARVVGRRLTGTLTAEAGACTVGPLRFKLTRSGR